MHFLIKSAFLTYYLSLSPNRVFRLWIGCIPVSAALGTLARLRAQCMDREFVLLAPAVINVLINIYVFILPVPTLATIQMPRRRKIAVISVFAFGGAAVIMGIIRFHSLLALKSIMNTSRGIGEIVIVAALELNLATTGVNLPAIRSIWIKKSKDRKIGAISTGQYGNKKGYTSDSGGSGRPKQMYELSLVSNPSRCEVWKSISGQALVSGNQPEHYEAADANSN
ncbi:hypothetical protein EK21DRAFT_103697 [Setomelanomma holmii]|uniref:Rhodopsin domain-containing protein n=1 Tax=Setomelanomma holmii TaxID=210430 RepID=A0A9P4LI09_9PLEO|nr:hypothetical protein EK21DRAFT_103697 [Setomelanomma holmii]